jgi:hypothetical protein
MAVILYMKKRSRLIAAIVLIFLLAAIVLLRHPKPEIPPAPPSRVAATEQAVSPSTPPVALKPKKRGVRIVGFSYEKNVAAPSQRLEFNVNGSGFTPQFKNLISVDPGEPEISVEELREVTPNQIHGAFRVSPRALTKFVRPRVLIHGKSVFLAPQFFGVVRPREVLQFSFVDVGADGRSGHFRIVTNLTRPELEAFRVESSTPGIVFSIERSALPFFLTGSVKAGDSVPSGTYGLRVFLSTTTILSQDNVIRVVPPQ